MSRRLKTAYVLARFPNLTATFIMNEMYWIRRQNVQIYIFSLFDPNPEPVHENARLLVPYTYYNPALSWAVLRAQVYFLHQTPRCYLRALVQTIRYTYREPKMLIRALAVFPKCVHFARQAKEIGIDHVHAHFLLIGSIGANIIAQLLDIPLTLHPHAVGLFTRNQHSIRRQLENATRIVTISSYHQDYIARLCPSIDPSTIEVIHCGIDTDRFKPVIDKDYHGPVQILSVGRLVEKKGHRYLVDACASLAERGLTFQCNIVGVGPDQEILRSQIERLGLQKSVRLLGSVDQTRIIQLCQTSDIYALACVTAKDGDRDGVPVSLMEAMACELPVVTTSIAGIPDLVRDYETGLIVQERDPMGLANALQELIEDKMLRQLLGIQARQKVVDDFEIGHNAATLSIVFRHATESHRHALAVSSVESPQLL